MKITPKITKRRPSLGVSLVLKRVQKDDAFSSHVYKAFQAASSFSNIPQLGDNYTPSLSLTCYVSLNQRLWPSPREKKHHRKAMFHFPSHLTFPVCQPGTRVYWWEYTGVLPCQFPSVESQISIGKGKQTMKLQNLAYATHLSCSLSWETWPTLPVGIPWIFETKTFPIIPVP